MQAHAVGGIIPGAILLIADDGVAQLGELHTDLMTAAGLQAQLDEAELAIGLHHFEVCDGFAGKLGPRHGIYVVRIALVEV